MADRRHLPSSKSREHRHLFVGIRAAPALALHDAQFFARSHARKKRVSNRLSPDLSGDDTHFFTASALDGAIRANGGRHTRDDSIPVRHQSPD
ncbi:hypothetical protein BSLA_01r2857 [Burkholderia stabilis]|nr:hypothetical protein BSLA_01r2857 [Burkholderia stabilis]